MVKQIQNFNEKQVAASLPDPVEEKRKEKVKLDTARMHQAVRGILDEMMSTIVTEVSLKLGGAMHAQQNAIKNIVDAYLGKNPVIEDRVHSLEDHVNIKVQHHVGLLSKELSATIPAHVLQQIEATAAAKLAVDMQTIDARIDQVRAAQGSNANVCGTLTERIELLEQQTTAFPNDIDTAIETFKSQCQKFTETHCSEQVELIKETISKTNEETVTKLTEEINGLKLKMDKGVKHADKHADEAVQKLQKDLKVIREKQAKSGGCCTIM